MLLGKRNNNWSNIGGDTLTALSTIQSVYIIDSATKLDEGYYRFIVSNPGTIDNPVCRVVSKPIFPSGNCCDLGYQL